MYKNYYFITLQHILCFIAMTEAPSMSKAASDMNMSQPLFSQKISQLESAINIKLFSRNKRNLIITPAGQIFLSYCKEMIDEFDNTVKDLNKRYSEGHKDTLTLGFSDGQEPDQIQFLFSLFKETFSGWNIEFVIDTRFSLIDKFLSTELDVVFITDTENLCSRKNLNFKKIAMLPLNCMVNTSSSLASYDKMSWHMLDGLSCVWPTHLKSSQLTTDILQQLRKHHTYMEFDYHDVDYFTIRRYLGINNNITFTLSQSVSDPSLKLLPMDSISYPFLLLWNHKDDKRFNVYVNKICETLDSYDLKSMNVLR